MFYASSLPPPEAQLSLQGCEDAFGSDLVDLAVPWDCDLGSPALPDLVAPSLPDEPPLNSSSLGCALNAPLDLNLLHLAAVYHYSQAG